MAGLLKALQDPAVFGLAFERIVYAYQNGIGNVVAPVFHLATIILFFMVIKYGNKHKKLFAITFTTIYFWLFLYVGLFMFYKFFQEMGLACFAFWTPVPFLLGNVLWKWFKEIKAGEVNLNLSGAKLWRILVVLPIMAFGFFYPTFIWGKGFFFHLRDLLFSFYGIMPCPTTMVILGYMTINYPKVNKGLYNALTLFAVWVGTLQLLLGYVPDYPLALVGYYALFVKAFHAIQGKKAAAYQG
ncbi:MAG TPA: hypothetical protein VIL66_07160 [Bacillota bacterium]